MGLIDRLEPFRGRLHPDLFNIVQTWTDDPELGRLVDDLVASAEEDRFLDVAAEVLVARWATTDGAPIRVELPTPAGRSCDFEIAAPHEPVYIHVKRLDTQRPVERSLTVSSHLRILERVPRPYIVRVRWRPKLSDRQMQQFVREAAEFIGFARVGDEITVWDEDGAELGGCLIVAPYEGTHAAITIGLPDGFVDDTPRMHKLLKKAYKQFMPRATNVILFGSSQPKDIVDFESALLGAHIERWDAHPPEGSRIAHGRASDGFWYGEKHNLSAIVGWFHVAPEKDEPERRLWFREGYRIDDATRALLAAHFGPVAEAS